MFITSRGDRVTINTKDDGNGGTGGGNGVVPDSPVKKPKIDSDPPVTIKTEKSFTTGEPQVQLGVLGSDPALNQKVRIVLLFSGDPSTALKFFNGTENLKTSVVWARNKYTA